jgi:hypothetical protein
MMPFSQVVGLSAAVLLLTLYKKTEERLLAQLAFLCPVPGFRRRRCRFPPGAVTCIGQGCPPALRSVSQAKGTVKYRSSTDCD